MTQRRWRTLESSLALKLRRRGKTYKEIGEALGRSGPSVCKHLTSRFPHMKTRRRRPWTTKEKTLVLRLRLQGKSWRTIARAVGRSRELVRKATKRWCV